MEQIRSCLRCHLTNCGNVLCSNPFKLQANGDKQGGRNGASGALRPKMY